MNKSEEGTNYCGNLSYHQDVDPVLQNNHFLYLYQSLGHSVLVGDLRSTSRRLTFASSPRVHLQDQIVGQPTRTLPPAHIESLTSIDSGRYQVTWSIKKPESADLTEANFLVITGPMYLRAFDEQASLYVLETVALVPYRDERTSYVTTFNTSVDEAEHVLIIRLKRIDEDGNPQLVMGVVVPSVAVLLVLALGVLVLALAPRGNVCRSWLRRKTRHGTLQPVKSWRPSYRIRRKCSLRIESIICRRAKCSLRRTRNSVSYDRIHLGKQIGRGAFGRVFLARIDSVNGTPIDKMIAVKKLKHRASPDELDDFLTEISTFKRVGHHPNVVSLVGCCTLTLPYCMLMEWVPCGDLLRYLRRLRAQLNKQLAQVAAAAAVPPPRPCRHTTADNPYIDILPERGSSTTHSESSSQMQVDGPSSLGNSSSSGQARRSPPSRQASTTLETPAVELDARELHSFALQIARGMVHLERQQITH
ncbi:hypothetical protein B566_EDAN017458, partial [Ephemera danica]